LKDVPMWRDSHLKERILKIQDKLKVLYSIKSKQD